MEEFWILILVTFFDEIFGEGWWDKDEAAEDLKMPAPTNFGQNVYHQIDRQNTQIGQIEPNSIDQLGQLEPNSTDQNAPLTESDHSGQIEPKSTDQNPPLTDTDHSGQIKPKSTDQNPPLTETISNWKRELGQTKPNHQNSHSEQNELMKRYYEIKDQNPKIRDTEIAKNLKIGRTTLVKWKKQFKRQQFHPNSVDGPSVEGNTAANVQKIENSNSESI
uniref:Uncharacterized protein n=1 Tax=Globodera rostochiensis TaxID=31243 RepID=A0A914HPJ6_GLORO